MGKTEEVRWGVIGPGRIAHRFAQCLPAVPGARLVGVASRSSERARAFARAYGASACYDDVAALCGDAGVDAVYIASTHNAHSAQALAAVSAGKAVLCEKPFTVNRDQAAEVIAAARGHGIFLMEAMWTRFLPAYVPVRHWLAEEAIGSITGLEAWFGYEQDPATQPRLYDASVAGGSLLDAGVYCVSIAQWLFGGPLQVHEARAQIGPTGVDEDLFVHLSLGRGKQQGLALRFRSSLRQRLYNAFVIHGERGRIVITDNFWDAGRALLVVDGRPVVSPFTPFDINGFEYQVREVHRCLTRGAQQSDTMPWDDSLQVMGCLDDIRQRIGLRYPFETKPPTPHA